MSLSVSAFGLGGQLDTRGVPDNPWISAIEVDARNVLKVIARPFAIQFAVTERTEIQAAANFQPPVILMTFGLADLICRLAAQIVTAGIFVNFGETKPNWTPHSGNSVKSVASQLNTERFIFDPAFMPWIDDPERQMIFAYLLISMSRFVVMHEAGHIGYGHGRKPGPGNRMLERITDGTPHDDEERAAAIVSQAKEIAADGYAFNTHLRYQMSEFNLPDLDPMRRILKERLAGTPRLQLRWTLMSAFLVFRILDRRSWTIESARLSSHPPAPFRVKSLYAAALELKLDGLAEAEIVEEVSVAQTMGSAILDIGLNRLPNLRWVDQANGPAFDTMFMDIFNELHNWTVWNGGSAAH